MIDIRVINIDKKLHRAFKILCVKENISMSQKLKELMRQALSK